MTHAIVVFRRIDEHWASGLLRRYDHVFCVLETGNVWTRLDAMDGIPVCVQVAALDYDLATFYRGQGYGVLEGACGDRPTPPLVLGNCVGLVKSFIGVRCRAMTPYGLYKHLKGTGRWT